MLLSEGQMIQTVKHSECKSIINVTSCNSILNVTLLLTLAQYYYLQAQYL